MSYFCLLVKKLSFRINFHKPSKTVSKGDKSLLGDFNVFIFLKNNPKLYQSTLREYQFCEILLVDNFSQKCYGFNGMGNPVQGSQISMTFPGPYASFFQKIQSLFLHFFVILSMNPEQIKV
jgi:hypothetical protein